MYAVSDAFKAALTGSHIVVCRADILSNNEIIVEGLYVTDGAVDVDGDANVRRRCSLTVADSKGALASVGPLDPLSPYGNEIRLYRGIALTAGDEVAPLGTFRIASTKAVDEGTIEVTGFDRARSVQRARFVTPYIVKANRNYATAIATLVGSRLPGVVTDFMTTSEVTPVLIFDQASDPWKAATDMAQSIGAELFFDPLGVCVLRAQADLDDPVVASYVSGETATILSIENALSDEPGYNGFVVDGEPPDLPPVHVVQWDTEPDSPTYPYDGYGEVPFFLRSQMITTVSQANRAAAAGLLRERGGTEQLTFEAIPHPGHEAGDVVNVARSAMGIDDNYLVQSFSIPLSAAGTMNVSTRKRRTI